MVVCAAIWSDSCNDPLDKSGRGLVSSSLTIDSTYLAYATWSNRLIVEDRITGAIVQRLPLADICYPHPIIVKNNLFFPRSDSEITCYNLQANRAVWAKKIPGRCTDLRLAGDAILADIKSYGIIAFDPNDGSVKYELRYRYGEHCLLPDLSPYRKTQDDEHIYICDWQCNSISAFGARTGELIWAGRFGDGQANACLANGKLFVGVNDQYQKSKIYLLEPRTGEVIFSSDAKFEQNFNPIPLDDAVLYYAFDHTMREVSVSQKSEKVVFRFDEKNDVGGHQMFRNGADLYYSSDGKVFSLNINTHKLTDLGKTERDLCGVTRVAGQIRLIY